MRTHHMCPFHSSVVSINVNWHPLLSPIATIMRRLYFLLYISTFFSSVPNRCIPDRRQLPSNAAPKHTTTYGDVIQIKQAYRGKKKKTLWNLIYLFFSPYSGSVAMTQAVKSPRAMNHSQVKIAPRRRWTLGSDCSSVRAAYCGVVLLFFF